MPSILIADDHPLFLEGLALLLSSRIDNVEIRRAPDLAAVEWQLAEKTVDLLLLDRVMPGMNGFQRLPELAGLYPALPVAIISASDSSQHIREALDAGAAGFIPKTSSPDEVVAAVQRLLAGKAYIPRQAWRPAREVGLLGDVSLSVRQQEILELVSKGDSNKLIARQLGLSEGTIKQHLNNIFRELQVSSRTQAVQRARDLGFLS